ncbi:ATP-binding cassette domain-containing protein [Tannockella kyphosi]|uniref:ATP-binding cassette domain-containing protein n=1 Tax=Tannockella kyphosi TaxID=2899121 RepID=UPI0020132979|nr:ATP-binding cassette domain-containing protein [Tannockella kyphosi]
MIKLTNIHIEFDKVLLDNENLEIYDHEITLLYGKSGSGKTTLLYRVGLLSSNEQEYIYKDIDITHFSDKQKSNLRQMNIGYVIQESSLFEQYDVLGNMKLCASFTGKSYTKEEYQKILDKLRLEIEFEQPIQTLSGGEKQRLAIACALCKDVEILILDEPTSALDSYNAQIIFEILEELKKEKTILLVSHDDRAKEYSDRIYNLEDKHLYLEKETSAKSEMRLTKLKYTYAFTFYKKYISYFFNAYKGFSLFMTCLFFLSSFLVCSSLLYIDELTNENIQLIKDTSINQLFVQVDNETLDYLENSDYVERIYPYTEMKVGVDGTYYDVYPYYNQDSVIDSLEVKLNNEGDTYTSSEVYKSIFNSTQSTSEVMTFDFVVQVDDEFVEFEYDIEVGGFLKESTNSYYGSDDFLYVSEELFQELMDLSGVQTYEYYTVFTTDYDALIFTIHIFEENNLYVESGFNNIELIDYVIKEMNTLCMQLLIIIFVVSAFFITILQVNYFYKRNIEFSLLKINGLNNRNILLLVFYELCSKAIISSLLSIPLFIVINVIIGQGVSKFFYFIFINIIFMIFIITSSMFFNYLYIKKLNLQEILRT